jgi:hypothetical protein
MLKIIYTIFLGLLLAIFIGVGAATFYPAPQSPEPPLIYERPVENLTPQQEREEANFRQEQEKFQNQLSSYNRNISIITFVAAMLFLVISLALAPKVDVISDGLLLGGTLTLVYSLGRGLVSQDSTYRFLIISMGLAVALILGYIKFIKPSVAKKS